jgi:hypothetical protein
VGEIAVLARRRQVVAVEHVTGARQLERVTALLAQGASEDEVWEAVRDGIVVELGLKSCHFEPGGGLRHLPRIERDGRLLEGEKHFTGSGFALPSEGVEILVERGGAAVGRLVLEPSVGRAVSRDQRRVAVALADSFAVVVGRSGAPRALA